MFWDDGGGGGGGDDDDDDGLSRSVLLQVFSLLNYDHYKIASTR